MNDFDKALKELDLTFAQTELIKQAASKYLIGNKATPYSQSDIEGHGSDLWDETIAKT